MTNLFKGSDFMRRYICNQKEMDKLIEIIEAIDQDGRNVAIATVKDLDSCWRNVIENILEWLKQENYNKNIEKYIQGYVKNSLEAADFLAGFTPKTIEQYIGPWRYPSDSYLDNLKKFADAVKNIHDKIADAFKNNIPSSIREVLEETYTIAYRSYNEVSDSLKKDKQENEKTLKEMLSRDDITPAEKLRINRILGSERPRLSGGDD